MYQEAAELLADWSELAAPTDTWPEPSNRVMVGGMYGFLGLRYAKLAALTDSADIFQAMIDCLKLSFENMPTENTQRMLAVGYTEMARFLVRVNDLPHAYAHASQATEVDPDYDNAWWVSHWLLRDVNNEESLACLLRAAELGHEEARQFLSRLTK